MFKTLRRASVILSLFVFVTVMTSTNFLSESALATTGPGLAGRGEALLRTIDFSLSDGLAQLTIKRDAKRIYGVQLDLREAVTKMGEKESYRPALLMLALWILSPALLQALRGSRKHPAASEPGPAVEGAEAGYRHIRGLTLAQVAKSIVGVASLAKTTGQALFSMARPDVRIRRYHPRHARGPRHKTVIVEFGRRGGFAA